ncbi:hypothetical protein J2S74_002737 [Evansella vedderi]|uniref:ATP-grasp domain-containing protein n=1 Tax=Evansella vedderi TaxID=38282 RepID=A0ABT9ZZ26_9BACI|nr:YheC/YheD family protein [Evansella vedderi]MDQ0255355.1 hypothetical protein [Evansella vedderi]
MKKLKRKKHLKRKLVEANKEVGTNLFYCSLKNIDFENNKIKGLYFNYDTDMWEEREFPFPDVLYRRTPSLTSRKYKKLREKLRQHGVKRLNYENNFNKWEVYQGLKEMDEMNSYLPWTERYKNKKGLEEMINIYTTVYLKAHKCGRGEQVMRIQKNEINGYDYSYHSKKGLVRNNVETLSELVQKIKKFFRKDDILMQQGIDLISIEDSLVDFRAEVQRNGQGEIEIIAICARSGQKGSPITTHASSYTTEDFFKSVLDYSDEEFEQINLKMKDFLEIAYKSIESLYGVCGEIGIDFGLDKNGEIWYIECNSKSAKVSLKKAYGEEGLRRSSVNLLEYAKYIANQEGGYI